MSRINTNVQSLIAQRVLGQNNLGLNQSLERLSTGLRINRGKDDAAGLIASENLRSEIRALGAAINNAERADQVVNIAEGGLQEVSSLLTELQSIITTSANTAGMSPEELKANQLQIDSILQTIDRVSAATNFQGRRLLNGNLDYQVSGISGSVQDFRINGAKFQDGALDVNVLVTQSAQQAGLFLSMGGTQLNVNTGSSFTIEIAGSLGARELTFASGTTLADVAKAVNTLKEVTGIEAAVSTGSGTGIALHSTKFGSSEFVSVKIIDDGGIGDANEIGVYRFQSDDFNTVDASSRTEFGDAANNAVRDRGQNLGASINGVLATSDGRTARINTDFLDVQLTLSSGAAQTLGPVGTQAFTITGGGADFQLASKVDIVGRVSLGIADVATRKLGNSEVGFLSELAEGKQFNVVNGSMAGAQQVVAEAIQQLSGLRGRLGAFQQNVVGATVRSLGISMENTQAAESVIRDADFAAETAGLTRSQILVAASTNVLALANQTPQSALQLLG